MIEQAMIFMLGACIAGLFALICLPAISRRAMRFAQIAAERQMPISVDEIVAQRDLLRAEFATERRRGEQALEQTRAAHADEMRASGRRAAEIGRLSIELAAVSAARDTADAARKVAERHSNETETENGALQKSLYDAEGLHDGLRERLAKLSRDHDTLTGAFDAVNADLASARAQRDTLGVRIDEYEAAARASAATEAELRRRIAELEECAVRSEDIDLLRRTISEIGLEVVRLAQERTGQTVEADERPTPVISVH